MRLDIHIASVEYTSQPEDEGGWYRVTVTVRNPLILNGKATAHGMARSYSVALDKAVEAAVKGLDA